MSRFRIVGIGMVAAALIAALAASPAAAEPADPLEFEAGVACDFALTIEFGDGTRTMREFRDADGNLIKTIEAGRGLPLTFANDANGEEISTTANGAVNRTVFNPDGTSTTVLTGHYVLIMFPTDVPAGPSTTLYVGRVEFTVDANDVYTLQRVSGRSTDICAALES